MTTPPTCPVCERRIEDRDSSETFPFCSERCKRVDLSRWLDESYAITMTPHTTERTVPSDDRSNPRDD